MKKLGYKENKDISLYLENANGDMTTVNSILDKFLHDKVDFVHIPREMNRIADGQVNQILDRQALGS